MYDKPMAQGMCPLSSLLLNKGFEVSWRMKTEVKDISTIKLEFYYFFLFLTWPCNQQTLTTPPENFSDKHF